MNITSLLQEAPSRDRTRRKQSSWEENGGESNPKTTSLEELPAHGLLDGTTGTANKTEFPQLYYPKQPPPSAPVNPLRPEDDKTNETKTKDSVEQISSQKAELASNVRRLEIPTPCSPSNQTCRLFFLLERHLQRWILSIWASTFIHLYPFLFILLHYHITVGLP